MPQPPALGIAQDHLQLLPCNYSHSSLSHIPWANSCPFSHVGVLSTFAKWRNAGAQVQTSSRCRPDKPQGSSDVTISGLCQKHALAFWYGHTLSANIQACTQALHILDSACETSA